MRSVLIGLSMALALCACGPKAEEAPAKPKYGAWGYDQSAQDSSVKPGDNFYAYALGGWIKSAKIPPDRSFAGVDLVLMDQLDANIKTLFDEAAARKGAPGSIEQKIADFYASFMDENAIEGKGVTPIKPDLAEIDAAADKAALGPIMGKLARADGGAAPLATFVDIDPKDPTRYVPVIWQSGLSFRERDYYLKDDAQFKTLREKFLTHAEKLLALADYADAKEQAGKVLALETKIAQVQWTPEKEREVDLTTNIRTRAQLEKLGAGAPIGAMLDAEGVGAAPAFRVGQPDVVTKTAQLIAKEPLDSWKAYLRYHTIAHYAPFLSKPFADEQFDFYGKTLNGVERQRERWKRGIDLVDPALGEAVGQLYVAKHFPASSKAQVEALVENLRKALGIRLQNATWMSEATKKEAQAKLAAFLPKLGYPDTWKSYDTVTVDRGDLIANVKSAEAWAWNDQIGKLGKPIDRAEWLMTPQTVNAYYRPETNEVTFPAGILQPPYFDPNADAAANYGAIGAVIGHELSHGFDDQGRKTDATGKLRDWWTKADAQRYNAEAQKLVKQFDEYEPLPGQRINGQHTLGENIADLAGLVIAYDAYKLALDGKEAPVIGGVTGDQRFFLAYAQSWQMIQRPERLRDRLLTDEHAPAEYRVNGIVRNFDPWYAAFGVKEGDKLYLRPQERVRIW